MEPRYWPFDVLPAEQRTLEHEQQIAFLEAAHTAGYPCCMFGTENFGAESDQRTAFVLRRTRLAWELVLEDAKDGTITADVNTFPVAADVALLWLRGEPAGELLETVRPNLVCSAERPSGYFWADPVPNSAPELALDANPGAKSPTGSDAD